jgi:hypothetical protein
VKFLAYQQAMLSPMAETDREQPVRPRNKGFHERFTRQKDSKFVGVGICFGVAIGCAIGVAIGNLSLGIGPGVAIGVVIGALIPKSRR